MHPSPNPGVRGVRWRVLRSTHGVSLAQLSSFRASGGGPALFAAPGGPVTQFPGQKWQLFVLSQAHEWGVVPTFSVLK